MPTSQQEQPVLLTVRTTRATRDQLKIAAIVRGTTVQSFVDAAIAKALAESRRQVQEAMAS
jgi:uncharacterized protein (DUF1778 family)